MFSCFMAINIKFGNDEKCLVRITAVTFDSFYIHSKNQSLNFQVFTVPQARCYEFSGISGS